MADTVVLALQRLRGAVSAARVLAGGRIRATGGVVLAYHDVGVDPANHTDYYVSPARLRQHLVAARRFGLRYVDLATLVDRFLAGEPTDQLCTVVFDDGLTGVHHHALPILAELDVPATVFAVSAELGADPPWWPGAARVMTEREMQEWAAAGMRICAHTRHHPSLLEVRGEKLRDEVAGSVSELEDIAGDAVDLFAYPFGHHDPAAREAVREAGCRAAFTFLNGRVTPGLDAMRLPRVNMYEAQHTARLAYHLSRPASSWPDHQAEVVSHQP